MSVLGNVTCDTSAESCLSVLGNLDLHELELELLISITTISLQVESLGEVELPCECPSRSVTSTRWNAEGGPLVNWVESDCNSVWEVSVGNGNSTAISCVLSICIGHSTLKGPIVTCGIWIVSRVCCVHSMADSSITDGSGKV